MIQCGKNFVQLDRPRMTTWRVRIACWIIKATNTHSEYVIFIAFPIHQLLQERPSMLRHSIMPNNCLSQLLSVIINQFIFAHCRTIVQVRCNMFRPSAFCLFSSSCYLISMVCNHISVYVCVRIHTHTHKHIYIYTQTHTHTYIYIYIYIYKNQSIPTSFQDNSVPGIMRLYPRRPDSVPPHIWLRYTRQGKRRTNSTHIERRRLASAEVWSSEQIFKTIYNVHKLHWFWKKNCSQQGRKSKVQTTKNRTPAQELIT